MSGLYLESLVYDIATLIVRLAEGGRPAFEVGFEQPRAFRSFSESDGWRHLKEYEGARQILAAEDPGCGVFMSETTSYLADYRANARAQEPERNWSCLILTPQECVEVICYEPPSIQRL